MPRGLRRFQQASALHFITFSCFRRLPLLEAPAREILARPPATAMTQYIYDAQGNRVAKGAISVWSCDTSTNGFQPLSAYILGPHSEPMTKMDYVSGAWKWAYTDVSGSALSVTYVADPTNKTPGLLYFNLLDWLGSRRQQTDYAGNPVLNFTGLPYGDGATMLSVSNTTAVDATKHYFTGKERDSESGNDYFGARYYASAMGRFLSPDPLLNSGHPSDPQSWNRYSYTRNNPLRRVDPTGLYDVSGGCLNGKTGANNCQRLKDAVAKGNELLKGMDPKSKAAKELSKALKALGTEGDHNGVTVSFGKTPTGAGSMETDGQHLTIDFNRLDAAQDNHQLAGEDIKTDVDDAGHTAHEGIHLANNKVREGQADEPEAYDVQSHVNEAGHSTSTSGVWNESWANGPDRELLRQNAVKEAAQRSVDAENAYKQKETKPQ